MCYVMKQIYSFFLYYFNELSSIFATVQNTPIAAITDLIPWWFFNLFSEERAILIQMGKTRQRKRGDMHKLDSNSITRSIKKTIACLLAVLIWNLICKVTLSWKKEKYCRWCYFEECVAELTFFSERWLSLISSRQKTSEKVF